MIQFQKPKCYKIIIHIPTLPLNTNYNSITILIQSTSYILLSKTIGPTKYNHFQTKQNKTKNFKTKVSYVCTIMSAYTE